MAATDAQQTLIVKLFLGTEIRRFTTSPDLTWASLASRITDTFEITTDKLKLTYVDDDSDVITISTDQELREAITWALIAKPSVLRLTVLPMAAGATDTTDKKKTTTTTGCNTADKPTLPPGLPAELAPFFDTLVKQLPTMMEQLPEGLKRMIPHAELDLAATLAANHAAAANLNNPEAAMPPHDSYCPPNPHGPHSTAGVHEGVTCDKSGMCPIVGARYHLMGHNYDLCQAEFDKLDEAQKALYRKIEPPGAPDAKEPEAAANAATTNTTNGTNGNTTNNAVHPGVTCDRSGMCPIVGTRYNLRGHNYDLCQAEFDKLPQVEKLQYEAIASPAMGRGMGCGPWRPGGRMGSWRGPWQNAAAGGGMAGGKGCGMGGMGGMGPPMKLAARFVRDVTIFDGTQMAPGTAFTKIWRLKNVGEVAWPPGTRMLFVGGDQMTSEMSVPLSRGTAVQPGEEVDVAVEMVAPAEHGRYLGYWRLTGPHMRRKFGQRVWCHVQVVDPSQSGAEAFEDMQTVLDLVEAKKKSALSSEPDEPDEGGEGAEGGEAQAAAAAASAPTLTPATVVAPAPADTAVPTTDKDKDMDDLEPKGKETTDGNASDDGVLVTDGMLLDKDDELPTTAAAKGEAAAADVADPGPSGAAAPAGAKGALLAMGFADEALIECVLAKHGEDVEACARDLAAASEWEELLDDLQEMGFANRDLNKTLMLKNAGNVKRTVRDLVEA